MDTQQLIEQLAGQAKSVTRLYPPWRRTALWLVFAVLDIAMFVALMSPRQDLGLALARPAFIVEELAALATGVTAALAAFASVVPGLSRRMLFLPLLPFTVWLGSVGTGCVQSWIHRSPAGLTLTPDWACLPATALIGMLPAVVITFMLRRGAPLTPHVTAALGGLAAAGLANFGLRLCHAQDASLMVLVWQIGAVLLLTAIAGIAGRWVVGWKGLL